MDVSKTFKAAKEAGPLTTIILLLAMVFYGIYKIGSNHLFHLQEGVNDLKVSGGKIEEKLDNLQKTQIEQTSRLIQAIEK